MNDNMYQVNTSAKSSVAAIIALTMPAAWADGPFVVTTLPAAVVHALPAISPASVIQNCADVGHGNGSYAPSDSNGAVGKNNIIAVTRAGIGLYDKSTCLLARYTESLESFFGFITPAFQPIGDTFLNAGYSCTRWFLTGEIHQYVFIASAIVSIDKAASLKGASVTVACLPDVGPFKPGLAPPIVLDGSVAQFLTTFTPFTRFPSPPPQTNIFRRNLTISPKGPAFDLVQDIQPVTIPSWSLWHGTAISPQLTQITQPNGQILSEDSAGFESFASPSIQAGGFIWNVHTICINGYARIRLYKLDPPV
jgi:hypothetical protein